VPRTVPDRARDAHAAITDREVRNVGRVASRLFVCYVPGLDRRSVDEQRTPFVHQLLATGPTVEIETMLGTDHLPTILTGAPPHEHRIWQVRLRPEARIPRRPRLTDHLPGIVSTSWQSLLRLVDRSRQLPTIPSRRRRQLDVQRAAFAGTRRGMRAPETIGGLPTVFNIVADSRFLFTRRLETLERLADVMPGDQGALELLEVHALDLLQHWHLDARERSDRAYRVLDRFVRGLHARCAGRGVTMMLLVDHGQEPVIGSIPLVDRLGDVDIPESDYSYFCDHTLTRFWFHTEEARARLTGALRTLPHMRMLSLKDLRAMQLLFEDDGYGELFLAADPGWVFFPNDHHHPLNNLLLGLIDPDQRPRLVSARPRGAHGYSPEHPSERGFAVLADARFQALRPSAGLLDVAPTLLALLGETPPSTMRGRAMFG
jgi:hypothetical protein